MGILLSLYLCCRLPLPCHKQATWNTRPRNRIKLCAPKTSTLGLFLAFFFIHCSYTLSDRFPVPKVNLDSFVSFFSKHSFPFSIFISIQISVKPTHLMIANLYNKYTNIYLCGDCALKRMDCGHSVIWLWIESALKSDIHLYRWMDVTFMSWTQNENMKTAEANSAMLFTNGMCISRVSE